MVEKLLKVCTVEHKAAVVVVASYRNVSSNPVRFKALILIILFVLPSITDEKSKDLFLDTVLFVVDKLLNRGYMRPFFC